MNFELYDAARKNNVKRAEELLRNGADPDFCVRGTMLTAAVFNGHFEICKLLVKHGANVDKKDSDDDYPIHCVFKKNNIEILSFLMKAGADVNVRNKEGDTPLHVAIRNSRDQIVECLLSSDNIDLEIKNNQGNSSLDLIQRKENLVCLFYKIKKASSEKARKICDFNEAQFYKIARMKGDLEMSRIVKEIEEKQREIAKLDIEINDLNERLTKVQTQRSQFEEERKKMVKQQEDLQKENENEVESFSWVKKDYECPVCLVVPYAPKQIVLCTNGHSMCSHCKEKLEICPICAVDLGITVRNFSMEKMLAESRKTINA